MVFDPRPIGAEHRIDATLKVEDGYRLECMCGWLSPLCPNALDMFDQWAAHCIDTGG